MSGLRRYGQWAGSPKGTPEDTDRCIAEVPLDSHSILFKQCSRKRGHGALGLYCKQHSKLRDKPLVLSWH